MSEQRTVDGRYRLDKAVGSGGMGVVWRAFDLRLGRVVAVKEVRFPSAMSDDERAALTKRAMLEAQSAGRLDHPNIVPVHDVILEGEQPFIIMRFVEGRSLDQTVSGDGPQPDRIVARIGVQLLDALGAAHAADVIHRDVKPHNVLIQTDGTAQLTDFSIASVFGTETLTKTGALLGSPGYIAPERLMTGSTTPAGDLFALGATLFFAAEGVGPFVAKETIVGLFASATQPHPRPKFAGPRLTRVIDGLLEKDPDNRLDRAQARALLTSIVETPEESETRSGEFVPPPPGRVDTDDRANRGFSQGDLPSDNSTAVFSVRRAPEQLQPPSWQPGPSVPVSSAPVSGAPISGATVYGRSASGGAVYGRPVSGAPSSGGAVYGQPVSGAPSVYGQPVSGVPSSGGPVYGRPVSVVPTSGVPVTGARQLGWDAGTNSGHGNSGHGNSGHGGPPAFRPPTPPTSPPAGQRWKRILAVVTIIVLGLGAGIIANLVATQNRTGKANRAGTIVDDPSPDHGDNTPTTPPTPGPETSNAGDVEPSPSGKSPPTTTGGPGATETTTSPPPVDVPGKVVSVSLTVEKPPAQVDCTVPLTISVTMTVVTSGDTSVGWSVSRGGTTIDSGTTKTTETKKEFSGTRTDTITKPEAGTYTYTGETRTPNTESDTSSFDITCKPSDPITSTPAPAVR